MKPKHHADGTPKVVYVQDLMDEWLGEAAARVILPITDPYVVHHGALGSFATAYLPVGADEADIIAKLKATDGIDVVLNKAEACERFELPDDRIGDIVLVSTENMTLGTSEHRHDLAALKEPPALSWRLVRAGSSVHRQPQAARSGLRARAAEFRRIPHRHHGRRALRKSDEYNL